MAIDNHQGVAVGYNDFSRAFDSVIHNKLLVKLASYGITNDLLAFIKDFLTDRTQHVVVDGIISSVSKVLSGVPQGSVPRPILFILYINDVVDSLPTSTTFADDLKIYSVLKIINDANSIFSAFDTIKQWASLWQLQINESKSNWLFIGRTTSSFNNAYFTSDNNAMSSASCIKDLGVFIDCDLSFSKHIDDIIRRAYQTTYMIYKGLYLGIRLCCLRPIQHMFVLF